MHCTVLNERPAKFEMNLLCTSRFFAPNRLRQHFWFLVVVKWKEVLVFFRVCNSKWRPNGSSGSIAFCRKLYLVTTLIVSMELKTSSSKTAPIVSIKLKTSPSETAFSSTEEMLIFSTEEMLIFASSNTCQTCDQLIEIGTRGVQFVVVVVVYN